MKILFSLTYYTPYISGLTLYVKRLSERLIRKGYKASVLAMKHKPQLKTKEKLNGVDVIRASPFIKVSKGFFSIDFVLKSFSLVKKSDVIVINLPQFEGFVLAIFGKLLNKKIISIYHCEVTLPRSFINKLIGTMLNFANFLTLLLSQRVVTYTEDFAKNSKILRKFSSKIVYVFPPIEEPKMDKRIQKILREKIGKKRGKSTDFYIGVAARLAAEKGFEYLFEAIPIISASLNKKRRKIKIIVAGSMDPVGEKVYKKKIMKLVKKYKKNVVFLGNIDPDKMGSFYSLLDVLVLASVNSTEAFGMVQAEAMMMGVPVIASSLAGVRIPVKTTGMGILVEPKNTKAIAEAFLRLVSNKKRYVKERQKIINTFNISKTVDFYERLFR